MSLSVAEEIWSELKRYLGPSDKREAAETLISILIDNHGYEAQDIHEVFVNDSFVRDAVEPYMEMDPVDFEEHEEEEYYEDEEEDEY